MRSIVCLALMVAFVSATNIPQQKSPIPFLSPPGIDLSSLVDLNLHSENAQPRDGAYDQDAFMSVPDIITSYGYPCEQHFITTSDGYILGVHRIPYGRSGFTGSRIPVLVMHGVSSSSADWIIAGTDIALGYALADAGYDVWLGNSRGNFYSRNHTYLNPDKDNKFWKFTFHELGTLDLPAVIDQILITNGAEKLFYIGHSQGTTIFYVLNSMKPEYNQKFIAHFSLSAVVYMSHIVSPTFRTMAFYEPWIEFYAKLYGYYEYLPLDTPSHAQAQAYCNTTNVLIQTQCMNTIFYSNGYDPDQFNYTLLPISMGHSPAGCALGQVLHFAQEVTSGKFCQWDYGAGNFGEYGSLTPPNYDLSKVTAPVYIFWSDNDYMSNKKDVDKLISELPNVKSILQVAHAAWNHVDYLWAKDVRTLVYDIVITLMNGS